jgi:membrane-associated phospholipid phosphatase
MKKIIKLKTHLFIILCFLLTSNFVKAQNADIRILRTINIDRNKGLDPTFKLITNTVGPISIGAPLLIYGIGYLKQDSSLKQKGIFIGETFVVATFLSVGLKYVVKRQRPFITYPEIQKLTDGGGYSFPSGHTSVAFSTATSLSMAFPKWYVIVPSFVWAGSVGYSRMDLGVHYPTDVLGGAILGGGSAYLTCKLNKWLNKKHRLNGTK